MKGYLQKIRTEHTLVISNWDCIIPFFPSSPQHPFLLIIFVCFYLKSRLKIIIIQLLSSHTKFK